MATIPKETPDSLSKRTSLSDDPAAHEGVEKKNGAAGELHQFAAAGCPVMTTNHGAPIANNQNSLRAGASGPTLLQDFIFVEKIAHFDRERIPDIGSGIFVLSVGQAIDSRGGKGKFAMIQTPLVYVGRRVA